MILKIIFAIAIIFSSINGIVTFFKFHNYISPAELLLLVFLRVVITFFLFLGLGAGVYFFLKWQIPQLFQRPKVKKPVFTKKVDYVLPSISPTRSTKEVTPEEIKKEEKKLIEDVTKADAEDIAMVIRTMMAEE